MGYVSSLEGTRTYLEKMIEKTRPSSRLFLESPRFHRSVAKRSIGMRMSRKMAAWGYKSWFNDFMKFVSKGYLYLSIRSLYVVVVFNVFFVWLPKKKWRRWFWCWLMQYMFHKGSNHHLWSSYLLLGGARGRYSYLIDLSKERNWCLPSLKLRASLPLKMDAWKMIFSGANC